MGLPGDDDWQRRVLERAKELDHEHRRRVRGAWQSGAGMAFSLRFLRTAARHLLASPRRAQPRPVPHPPDGNVAVTFVGHSTVLLTTPLVRLITDPYFGDFCLGLRRAAAACVSAVDLDDVNLVLISNAHRDHLDPSSLRRLPRRAAIIVPPRCVPLVEQLGFARVVELAPGQSFEHSDVEVTAVAARHDGARGLGDWSWRAAGGYLVRSATANVYFAGSTAYFSGFEEIGRRLHPDVALLPIAGYQPLALREGNMSPLDAVQAFVDLGAKLLVPVGYGSFPLGYEPLGEPLRWLREICAERGLAAQLAVLGHGETCLVRAAPVNQTPGA
jgi:L-ascorbate metabolism protein UlaG (beta-lactamase superfamily)